jgi:hypothetical protein
VKFTRIAREAEEFDRALRDRSVDAAYADELRLTSTLSAQDVRPDPAFTADLRATLLQAAREGALVAAEPTRPTRRTKRRWTIAAPAAAVALATGGVAFAVTGLQTGAHQAPVAGAASVESALSTAHTQLVDVSQAVRSGRPTATSLTTLRAQAMRLQDMLVAEYAAGRDPQAIRELHDFVVSAITQLADLHTEIPASLTSLYASTLQTLLDIAKTAESTCPSCGLAPVQVPTSIAPLVHLPIVVPGGGPTGGGNTTVPVTTPPGSPRVTPPAVSPTPSATPTGPGVPILPTALPKPTISLPVVLPTLPF